MSGIDEHRSAKPWKKGLLAIAALLGLAAFYTVNLDRPAPYVEWDIPEHPIAKAAYDYAHSIKLPDSVPKPVPFQFCKHNILGMCFGKATRDDYFQHLCKTEAGEYVFRRVKDVEGVVQLTPRRMVMDAEEALHPYALEDPVTYVVDAAFRSHSEEYQGRVFVQPPVGHYGFFDTYYWNKGAMELIHHFRDESADLSNLKSISQLGRAPIKWILRSQIIASSNARFGIALRGIRRERDRDFGVAGSELVLIDLEKKEVLAVKRDFARSPNFRDSKWNINWYNALSCLKLHERPSNIFISSVLQPEHGRD